MKETITIRGYAPGEENYVAEAHERIYRDEYGWGPAFSDYAALIAVDFARKPANPREALWVAEEGNELIGCIHLAQTDDPTVGQVRLFLVEKPRRGEGIGQALLETLMKKAKEEDYKRLILWTADPLAAAHRQYARFGFIRTESLSNPVWSLAGETIMEEKWELDLS